jgi:hypothetical protein
MSRLSSSVGSVLLILLLELPIALWFASYLGLKSVLRCHDLYLQPQIEALKWSDDRQLDESTYYSRKCDASDISASDAMPLFLDKNEATPQGAYDTFLEHGFVAFPQLLEAELASELRQFVLKKNRQTDPEGENNILHSADHRWLVTLGADEDEVVADTLKAVATHPLFRESIQKILGLNPALIELNVITSSLGAIEQMWHSDGDGNMSPMMAARSFAPTHVLLIQLQDTTIGMGPTQVCPGTHMCSTGSFWDDCSEGGSFPVVNADGYWPAGTGVLMNTNSLHRGGAYYHYEKGPEGFEYDPESKTFRPPHRAMLVVTMSSQPQARAETRMLTQGLSYSLPWYQWGHSLLDMTQAQTRLQRPWADLRALGLYNAYGDSSWGVDYISLWLRRIANEYDAIDSEDSLEEFLEEDEYSWLFRWLHGGTPKVDSWLDLGLGTLNLALQVAWKGSMAWAGVYLLMIIVASLIFGNTSSLFSATTSSSEGTPSALVNNVNKQSRICIMRRRLERVALRLVAVQLAVLVVSQQLDSKMDKSEWASDIRQGIRNVVVFDDLDESNPTIQPLQAGATTLPVKQDVLLESRLGSTYLAMYNDFVNMHPGTRDWRERVAKSIDYFKSPTLRQETANSIVRAIVSEEPNARFLYQNHGTGAWHVLSDRQAVQQTLQELALQAHPVLQDTVQALRFIDSDCRYGFRRATALCRSHARLLLASLRRSLLVQYDVKDPEPLTVHSPQDVVSSKAAKSSHRQPRSGLSIPPRSGLSIPRTARQSAVRRLATTRKLPSTVVEPMYYVTEGDIVLAKYYSGAWRHAVVEWVTPIGEVFVLYLGDDERLVVDYDSAVKIEDVLFAGNIIIVTVEPEDGVCLVERFPTNAKTIVCWLEEDEEDEEDEEEEEPFWYQDRWYQAARITRVDWDDETFAFMIIGGRRVHELSFEKVSRIDFDVYKEHPLPVQNNRSVLFHHRIAFLHV